MHTVLRRCVAALALLSSTCTWSQVSGPLIVAPGINAGVRLDMVIPADGLPLVVYQEATVVKALKCGNATCTSGNTISSVSPLTVRRLRLAIGSDGLPLIGMSVSASALRMARCLNAACSSVTVSVVDPANLGANTDHAFVVPADGRPLFAYYDSNNADLKYARCADASCSSSLISVIDSTGAVGNAPALALIGGLPQIAYNGGVSAFKLARCSSLDCTPGAAISTLSTDNALDTSMLAGKDGNAMVAYRQDLTSLDTLRLIRCLDASCSTLSNTVLDSTNSGNGVGNAATLRVGADGLPVVTYIDFSFAAVKLLRCTRQDCLSSTITTVHAPAAGVITSGHLGLAVGSSGTPVIAYNQNLSSSLLLNFCNTRSCL